MTNFRPFRGDNEVQLSTPGTSKLIVIFGENMRGKTAILSALRWGLYGQVASRRNQVVPIYQPEGGEQLLNAIAAENGDWRLQVAIEFEHGGKSYVVRRSAQAGKAPDSEADFRRECLITIDGNAVPDASAEQTIARVLSQEVSRFSLFDGEMLNDYERLLAREDEDLRTVRDAIERTLGLPALTHGRKALEQVAEQAERDQNTRVRREVVHRKNVEHVEQLQDALRGKEREQAQLREKLATAVDNRDAAGVALKSSERHQQTFLDYNRLESEAASAKEAVDARNKEIARVLSEAWWVSLLPQIAEMRRDLDGRIEQVTRTQCDLLVTRQLRQSMESGKCAVCGQPLSHKAEKALKGKLPDDAADESIAEMDMAEMSRWFDVRNFLAKLGGGEAAQLVRSADADAMAYTTEFYSKADAAEAKRKELGNFDKADHETKVRRWEQANGEASRLLRELEKVGEAINEIKEEHRREQIKVSRFSGDDPSVGRRAQIARACADAFERAVGAFREKARERVSAEASEIFKELTTEHEYSGLRINENYGLRILDSRGRELSGRSAGAEHIVALALIGGLNRAAAGGEAPVVMDTNFGRLDRMHRENVLKFVAGQPQQVILLVHSGEVEEEDLKMLDVRCARKYRIERLSEWQSELVKVDD